MSRPRKNRKVFEPPLFTEFKPLGIRRDELEGIKLNLDEFEALRLADFESHSHEEAADEMGVSRSTFSRLIVKSRKKVADFIIHGKILNIEGGNIHFIRNILKCHNCGNMFKTQMELLLDKCPECKSSEIISLAGGFGHGACCKRKQ